jgi:OOP family OmpA-OmpF porin
MKRLLLATALAAALASGGAFAQTAGVGPYVGGSFSYNDYAQDDCFGTCDKTDFGFKIFGGYMFSPNWGLEGAYGSYGKSKINVQVAPGIGANAEFKSSGFSGFVVGQLPMDNWRFFGKLGFARLDNELDIQSNVPGAQGSNSDTSTDLAWGLGATYMLNKNFGIRGEFEQLSYEFSSATQRLNSFSIGVQYNF